MAMEDALFGLNTMVGKLADAVFEQNALLRQLIAAKATADTQLKYVVTPLDPSDKREAADAAAAKAASGVPLTAGEAATALDGQHAPKKERAAKKDKPADPPTEPEKPAAPPKVEKPAPTMEYAVLKERILDVSAKFGRDKVTEMLKPFGVTRGQELKPEQYVAAHAAALAVLAGADAPQTEDDIA